MKQLQSAFPRICRAVLFLTICGCIGWIYETIFTSLLWGHFCGFFARGLLHVPVCPIYGFFALLLLALFRIPFLQRYTGWRRCIWAFLLGTSISTLLELGSSYLLEWFFGKPLWSYDGWLLNFQGRISLPSSLLFGALTLLLLLVVEPLFRRITARCRNRTVCAAGTICGLILCTDLIVTLLF